MDYADFQVGYKGTFEKPVTSEDNRLFGELSGDDNPVHFDDAVAQSLGFEGRISNGFVQESRLAGALVATFGSSDTVVVALQKNTKFLKPVYMNDDITATVEVVGRIEAMRALKVHGKCFNQHGEQVVETAFTIQILSPSDIGGSK